MAINVTLTSYVLSPWDGSHHGGGTNLIALSYADLDFTPSAADSYKSTSGDIFKVYVGGKRIYRRSDQTYASGSGFLEDGDASSGATLNGKTGSVNGNTVSWDSTTDAVWTIDTANRLILISKSAVAATDLYGSGTSALNIAFTGSSTIITLTRSVQDLKSPAIDFSNASILTEQDLDNSAKNVFHASQQAIISTENALLYSEGTDAYSAAQPGTSNPKKIQNVLTPTSANDATNKAYVDGSSTTVTVAGSIDNVNTVAGQITPTNNIATVAGIASEIAAVAGDATDIGAVAGKATEIGRLGTADAVADLAKLGTDDIVNDMNKLAHDDIVNDMNVLGTDANVTAMGHLGTSANVTNMSTITTGYDGGTGTSGTNTNLANINTVATNIGTISAKVSKSGDTMTGLLTLSGAPTSDNHASTKAYTDTQATALALALG